MSINLGSNIRVQTTLPLDAKFVAVDSTARDAILAGERYLGMMVFVEADATTYQLKSGTTNSDWEELGGGGATASIPVGATSLWASDVLPTGWLFCDGQAVDRTTYATLFAVIGTKWGQGDGSTTFNLPDVRGLFPRFADDMGTAAGAAGRDPDAASRSAINVGGNTGNNVGSFQTDAFESHTHTASTTDPGHSHNLTRKDVANGADAAAYINFSTPAGGGAGTSTSTTGITVSNANTGGNETRPQNAYFNAIIRYAPASSGGGSGGGSAAVTFGDITTPSSIVSANGINAADLFMSSLEMDQVLFIESSVANAETDVSSTPQIDAHTAVAARMTIFGCDDDDVVVLNDGNGLKLRSPWKSYDNSVLQLMWNGSLWVETSRST